MCYIAFQHRTVELVSAISTRMAESRFVSGGKLRQAVFDGGTEFGEGGEVFGVEAFLLDELPQPFDQIQVRGIRRQEQPLEAPRGGEFDAGGAVLITCVVQNDGDRPVPIQGGDLRQQFLKRLLIDDGRVADRNQLVSEIGRASCREKC